MFMFKRPQKQKEAEQIELTCSTCGKPIAGKARTDVTRYLFLESRCQCGQPKLVLKEGQEELKNFQALPYLDSVNAKSAGARAGDIPKQMPGWQMAILANLPAQYESQSLIGEGGMGTVWKVRDKNLNKTFAI